jgi:hypothetical protein
MRGGVFGSLLFHVMDEILCVVSSTIFPGPSYYLQAYLCGSVIVEEGITRAGR